MTEIVPTSLNELPECSSDVNFALSNDDFVSFFPEVFFAFVIILFQNPVVLFFTLLFSYQDNNKFVAFVDSHVGHIRVLKVV